MIDYRSKRMRAIHGLPPRTVKARPADKWTPDRDPGRLFQPWALTLALDHTDQYDPELSESLGCVVGEVDRWEEGTTTPTHGHELFEFGGTTRAHEHRVEPLQREVGEPPQCLDLFEGRGRWKIKRDRPDALLPDALFPETVR